MENYSNNGGLQVEVSWQLAKAAGMFGCLCQTIFAESLSVDTRKVFILLLLWLPYCKELRSGL